MLLNRSLANRVNNNIEPLEKGYEYCILILSYVSLYSDHFRRWVHPDSVCFVDILIWPCDLCFILILLSYIQGFWKCCILHPNFVTFLFYTEHPELVINTTCLQQPANSFRLQRNRLHSRYPPSLHALKDWWDESDVTWLLMGQTSDKFFQYKKSQTSLFILDNRKWTTYIKDDNRKLWLEVTIITFFNAVATVDVRTASNNDVNFVETQPYNLNRRFVLTE